MGGCFLPVLPPDGFWAGAPESPCLTRAPGFIIKTERRPGPFPGRQNRKKEMDQSMNRNRIASLLLALVLCLTLLPAAAMAEEEHTESYTITFDAGGGQFPDGSATMTVQTKRLGAGSNITAAPPDPVREGYTFNGWDIGSGVSIGNVDFTGDTTVKALWTEDSSQDGPFTVKFDLNYKNPKQSEIPKDKTVVKGDTVGLPDGKKLTSPAMNLEFYAWCIEGKDGKLYPWKETNPVTGDMTLYAAWVKKGSAVKDGQAIDAAPAEPQTPAEPQKPAEPQTPAEPQKPEEPQTPAAPAFTDVEAASPFAPAIAWAVEQGVTNGTTPTTFSPGNPCTRAQIVTFLWRAAGSPEPKTMEAEYADVTNTAAYYYKPVQIGRASCRERVFYSV